MATWRELSMPSRREVWRDLRGLRTSISGPARASLDRRTVFVAALEQAQQFMEAADGAGPATRPVQVFYSLSQFGRAIAAASALLGDGEWRLKGHGIGTEKLDTTHGLARVEVVPSARGSLPGVARAMGVSPFEAKRALTLGDIWPLIPEGQAVPIPGSGSLPALHYSPDAQVHREATLWCRVSLSAVPTEIRVQSESDPAKVDEFLARYPSLHGWSHALGGPDSVVWGEDGGPWQKLSIAVPSSVSVQARPDEWREEARRYATKYRGPGDTYAFPALGVMAGPVHPLLAWWAALFGLSILARYEPDSWAEIINIDRSSEANAVEHLLEQAIEVVPHLALLAIRNVATP